MTKVGAFGVIGVYALAVLLATKLSPDATWAQAWFVAISGLVVVWYTWETNRLRHLQQRQIELSQRPFVLLEREGAAFYLQNLGAGVALNCRVHNVRILKEANAFVRFTDSVPVMTPGARYRVNAESFVEGKWQNDLLEAHLDPKYANTALAIEIVYQNADLVRYKTVIHTKPGSFAIASFETSAT